MSAPTQEDRWAVAWGSGRHNELLGGYEALEAATRPQGTLLPKGVRQVLALFACSWALLADGTPRAAGGDDYSQCCSGSFGPPHPLPITPALTGVKALVGNGASWAALLEDGTVRCGGSNSAGQNGIGVKGVPGRTEAERATFAHSPVDPGLKGIVAIAAGLKFFLAIDSHGQVWEWGAELVGTGERTRPVKSPLKKVAIAVAGGSHHALALCADGTVMGWGKNDKGQLGTGKVSRHELVPVEMLYEWRIAAIAADGETSFLIDEDGDFDACGANNHGQRGLGHVDEEAHPDLGFLDNPDIRPLVYITAGGTTVAAIDNKRNLWLWGENRFGQCCNGQKGEVEGVALCVTRPHAAFGGCLSVSISEEHCVAVVDTEPVLALKVTRLGPTRFEPIWSEPEQTACTWEVVEGEARDPEAEDQERPDREVQKFGPFPAGTRSTVIDTTVENPTLEIRQLGPGSYVRCRINTAYV